MATIADVIKELEVLADPKHQESYDNVGLITGQREWEVQGVLIALDAIEEVIEDAIRRDCNMVVVHHPIIFKGLKKINGYHYVERSVIKAIKNDIAIYAIHTNLDNVLYNGVNQTLAQNLELSDIKILRPKGPEMIIGSGAFGYFKKPKSISDFQMFLKEKLALQVFKHTPWIHQEIRTVALCGGTGSFLIKDAIAIGAQVFITSDVKYHEFFEANDQITVVDIGHYESEQHTIKLLEACLKQKFANFAVLCTKVVTNPIKYYV